jgi:hypothetical protein
MNGIGKNFTDITRFIKIFDQLNEALENMHSK